MPMVRLPDCDYYALTSRPGHRPRADFWAIQLRDALPSISIPLSAGDADAGLDLQTILHRGYDAAHYEDYLDETQPEPALAPKDAKWASQFVPVRS